MNTAVGKILQDAREKRGLALDQVAGATYIRLRYLRAMEAGDFESLPSRVQVKGFLRSYADYLGLDGNGLLEMLESGAERPPKFSAKSSYPEGEPAGEADPPALAEASPVSRFVEVGQKLRAQRELLSLSLEDVERHTHLRIRYLRALETGDLDGLPSPVQGRGMLKNYAEFLGLSADPLLMTFADGLQANLTERRPEIASARPETLPVPSKQPKTRRFFNRDIFIAAFIVIFLLAFGVWGGMQIAELRNTEEQPVATPPSIAEVLLPSPSATLQPTHTATVLAAIDEGAIITPNPAANPQDEQSIVLTPVGPIGPVRLQIVVRERAYMRIIVDGDTEFDGRVLAGSVYAFAGEELIEIITGSGSALQVFYNEQDVGVLGTYGEAVDFVITIDGVQTPTPTLTLTPTETLTPEVTPTPNP